MIRMRLSRIRVVPFFLRRDPLTIILCPAVRGLRRRRAGILPAILTPEAPESEQRRLPAAEREQPVRPEVRARPVRTAAHQPTDPAALQARKARAEAFHRPAERRPREYRTFPEMILRRSMEGRAADPVKKAADLAAVRPVRKQPATAAASLPGRERYRLRLCRKVRAERGEQTPFSQFY